MHARQTTLVTMAVAAALTVAGPAAANDRLIHQAKDGPTGAAIRVTQTASGPRVDVMTSGLAIRKEVRSGTVVTTIRSGRQSLVIELGPAGVTVSNGSRAADATARDGNPSLTAKSIIGRSALAASAAALLGRLDAATLPVVQPVLLTTRAMLLAAANDDSGVVTLRQWMQRLRLRSQVVNTSSGQRTPSDCWKGYGDEVLDAFDAYVDCANQVRWWNPLGDKGCAVVFEVRIIGASTWYASCVSLGGLIGR